MTKGTFGDNLKREREMRGVTLDEISAATRIATRFLEAIENEQWNQLPGGIFNRGFVRAVAHYLGLDEEKIVAEYLLAADEQPKEPVWTGKPPAGPPDRRWLGWVFAVAAVLALVAVGWFGARRIVKWRAARRAAVNASTSPPAAEAAAPSDLPPSSGSTNASSDAASDSTADAATATSGAAASANAAPATTTATADAAPMELAIETLKKTKVTVAADSDQVFNGTVLADETHTFSAKSKFQISTRDGGALILQLNGKTLPPIGPLGHPGKITLTREALKAAAGGEN